jgi:peptidoglycan/LPS O-acetylase OafA/YrhL
MKKLAYVDSLRGLAVLGVLLVHTNQFGSKSMPWLLEKIAWKGSMGVQLFFLASAFTLFLSYRNRQHTEISPVRNFFLRRYFRIAPMYSLAVFYYLWQDGLGPRYWLGDAPGISVGNVLGNLAFLHGFNPYWFSSIVHGGWSIGVEMQFYVLVPLLFAWITNRQQAYLFLVFSLLLQLILRLVLSAHPLIGHAKLWEEYLSLYLPAQLPVFGLGILLYFLVEDSQATKGVSGKWLLALSGVMLAFLMIMDRLPIPPLFWLVLPESVLYGVAFLLLALGLSRYPWPVLVNPVIGYIGKISFSLYLVHFAVLHGLKMVNLTDFVGQPIVDLGIRYVVVLGLSGLLASLCYHFIEVPGQQLGSRVIRRLEVNTKETTYPSGVDG